MLSNIDKLKNFFETNYLSKNVKFDRFFVPYKITIKDDTYGDITNYRYIINLYSLNCTPSELSIKGGLVYSKWLMEIINYFGISEDCYLFIGGCINENNGDKAVCHFRFNDNRETRYFYKLIYVNFEHHQMIIEWIKNITV